MRAAAWRQAITGAAEVPGRLRVGVEGPGICAAPPPPPERHLGRLPRQAMPLAERHICNRLHGLLEGT